MYNPSLMRSMLKFFAGLALLVSLGGLGSLGGCGVSRQPYVTADRLERGLVLVLPGIEGRSRLNEQICKGLDDGGVNCAIEIYDWTSNLGMLYNLQAIDENRRKAKQIADRVARYQIAFPSRPVTLVGQSGGGGMAVWAAEAMNPEQKITGLVLINPSLSPQYLLSDALDRTEKGIVLLYSERDWMLLGVGTTVYGTMDGKHGVSAGCVGFETPTDRPKAYKKLYQIAWTKDMAKTGHRGGHFTSAAAGFVARYIAPLVMAEAWSKQFLAEIQSLDMLRTIGSPGQAPEGVDTTTALPLPQTMPAQAEPNKL